MRVTWGMITVKGIKETDYVTRFRCAGGIGILREELWVDQEGKVSRYNLAFLLPHIVTVDHGRVLGFDNAHGIHERHFLGTVEEVPFQSYPATAHRFYQEAEALRRSYETQDSSRWV